MDNSISHLLLSASLLIVSVSSKAIAGDVSTKVDKTCTSLFLGSIPNNLSRASNKKLLDFMKEEFGSCNPKDMVSISTAAIDIPGISDDIILRAGTLYYLLYKKDGVFVSIPLEGATSVKEARGKAREKVTGN